MMSSLMAVLGLDVAPFKRGVMEAQADARKAGRDLKEAFGDMIVDKLPFASAAGAVAGLEEMVRRSIEWGDEIAELSARMGISTDAVQLWGHALSKEGSSIEAAAGFFEKLGISRQKAMSGSDKELEAFKSLGVTIDDLKSKRIEDIALQVAKVFESGDPQKLINDLRAVGGKSAGEMIPAFVSGLADQVGPDQTELHIVSEEDIARLAEASDQITTIWNNLKGMGATITVGLMDGFRELQAMIAGTAGALTGYLGSAWDGLKRAMHGEDLSKLDLLKNPFKAGSEKAKEWAQAVRDQYALDDMKAKEAYDKRRDAQKGGMDEDSPTKAANRQAKEAESVAKEILRLKNETARVQAETALKEMTAAERVAELQSRIARVKAEIVDAYDDKDEAQSQLNLAKLEAQLQQAEKDAQKEEDQQAKKAKAGDRYRTPEVNSLQRIGAYVSPQEGMKTIAEKSEAHLATMREQLTELVKNSRNTRF